MSTRGLIFRSGWSFQARSHDLKYSQFISGLAKANVKIDRKVLAEMAVSDPTGFAKIVEIAKGKAA